jgi:hypothetical protein
VLGPSGKRLRHERLQTSAELLKSFIKEVPRPRHLCMEDGTLSEWLFEELTPVVDKLVVVMPDRTPGNKSDLIDACKLADDLRRDAIRRPVYKAPGCFRALREAARTHYVLQRDKVRTKSRLNALCRGSAPAVAERTPCSHRPRRFRGRASTETLAVRCSGQAPVSGYAPSELPTEAMALEAQRRGWCPLPAPRTRLPLGNGAHAQHRLRSRLIGDTDNPLRPSPAADRTRFAKTNTIPLGARPTADAPLSILTPHPSKRFQLRRSSEREGRRLLQTGEGDVRPNGGSPGLKPELGGHADHRG